MESVKIIEWISGYGRGIGSGDGNGRGYGNGDGDGHGRGYGNGYGDGSGRGSDDYGSGSDYGYGYGDGSGRGSDDYGSGSDYGYGFGNGSGNESEYDYGDGSGSGSDYGNGSFKSYAGKRVCYIDETPTIIHSIHGDIAKGETINAMRATTCYIARHQGHFAHGETAREAMLAAMDKYNESRPLEERIAEFVKEYPTLDSVASNKDLFAWHHTLTGSCLFGRKEFARSHAIDVERGSMSVSAFIELTKESYGGANIQQLEKAYKK